MKGTQEDYKGRKYIHEHYRYGNFCYRGKKKGLQKVDDSCTGPDAKVGKEQGIIGAQLCK